MCIPKVLTGIDFTLASGAFIYLSLSEDPKLCIENLFTKGNVVIRVAKIAALHKSKPGIFGKGTGGQIELLSGKVCFHCA